MRMPSAVIKNWWRGCEGRWLFIMDSVVFEDLGHDRVLRKREGEGISGRGGDFRLKPTRAFSRM